MGLFDFIKSAGHAVGIGSAEAAPAPEALTKQVQDLGLETSNLDVKVEGDTVKISGDVPDQATKEKVILAMGNVAGVAKVEETLTPASAEPESVMYTVKKGDTLGAIAKAQYGKASLYPKIFEANKPMLKDPDLIYPGQMLRIPPLS